jgi:hypothetical protein
MRGVAIAGFFLLALGLASRCFAEDAYFEVPLDKLALTEGQLPAAGAPSMEKWELRQSMRPYIVLDGPGEAYGQTPPPANQFELQDASLLPQAIVIHTPQSGPVTGRLFLAKPDSTGMMFVRFKVPADAAKAEAKLAFYLARQAHYEQLLRAGLPGGAWFRHEVSETSKITGRPPLPENPVNLQQGQTNSEDDTFALFSGGRAISENLQLDRVLPATRPSGQAEAQVDLKSIEGLSVQPMDWKPLIAGLKPETDPLATLVPADQHAIFFASFSAMVRLLDEAERSGTPALQWVEARSEDAATRDRYERQLGVPLTDMGRVLGPQLIGTMAITGSDPYFRTGTDLAILFEPKNPSTLQTLLLARIAQTQRQVEGAAPVDGRMGDVAYKGAASPDRSLSAYVARVGDAVVLTNSLAQLARLADTDAGRSPSLATQPEYTYFRDRYRRGEGDETALVVLSDAAIRRWCSPRWRIADSRRTRAAAALAEMQARSANSLVNSKGNLGPIEVPNSIIEMGQTRLTRQGVHSSIYGSNAMMTPIVELPIDHVTQLEADAYKRWRDTYQQNWRWFFDPIAVRFSTRANKVAADLTVAPLIWASDYRDWVDVSRGVKLAADAGDPHDALIHLIVAINTNSAMLKRGSEFAGNLAPGLKVNPLGWLGQSVSIYLDDDPFWTDLASAKDPDQFMQKNVGRIPVAIRAEVSNGLELAAFMVALRGFIEQTAPDMTAWENLKHEGQSYVKISPSVKAKGEQPVLTDAAIYYAVCGSALLITPNEALLWRALDRETARAAAAHDHKPIAPTTQPWLGESLAVRGTAHAFDLLEAGARDAYQAHMQSLSWSNLPILNEWKRQFPGEDPQSIHGRLWHARLLDPAGGRYVWNEQWQTMESTIYGHPGEPKQGPASSTLLRGLVGASLGVTFEDKGLRGRAELDRADTTAAK